MGAVEALAEVEIRCYLRVLMQGPEHLLRKRDQRDFVEEAIIVGVVGLTIDDATDHGVWRAELDDDLALRIAAHEQLYELLFG